MPASRLLASRHRERGRGRAHDRGGCMLGDGETAKLVPGIEANDGASVWNVDRPWIGMVGVERYGLKLQCVGPIMQQQATTARPRDEHAV